MCLRGNYLLREIVPCAILVFKHSTHSLLGIGFIMCYMILSSSGWMQEDEKRQYICIYICVKYSLSCCSWAPGIWPQLLHEVGISELLARPFPVPRKRRIDANPMLRLKAFLSKFGTSMFIARIRFNRAEVELLGNENNIK